MSLNMADDANTPPAPTAEYECADMLRRAFAADDLEWVGDVTNTLALTLAERDKCCGNADWRGRFCQYHQGIEQGLDLAVEILLNRTLTARNDGPVERENGT